MIFIFIRYTIGIVDKNNFITKLGQTLHRLTFKKILYALHCGNEGVLIFLNIFSKINARSYLIVYLQKYACN
jgi:hypothetical protein